MCRIFINSFMQFNLRCPHFTSYRNVSLQIWILGFSKLHWIYTTPMELNLSDRNSLWERTMQLSMNLIVILLLSYLSIAVTKTINIRLNKTTGIGTLECAGWQTFKCGGMPGFPYPSDSTVNVSDKKGTVYSREFNNAEMKYSVLWLGQRGVYLHEWPNLTLSHGCIHLLAGDAKKVYDWIDEKTRILFTWSG